MNTIEVLSQSTIGDQWLNENTSLVPLLHTEKGFEWDYGTYTKTVTMAADVLEIKGWYKIQKVEVGDWVFDPTFDIDPNSDRIVNVSTQSLRDTYNSGKVKGLRLATKEEIDRELLRRKWAKHNRRVDQYKVGDIVMYGTEIYFIKEMEDGINPSRVCVNKDKTDNGVRVEDASKNIELLCPVEYYS